jgi:beta-glucanase (GH16 family)
MKQHCSSFYLFSTFILLACFAGCAKRPEPASKEKPIPQPIAQTAPETTTAQETHTTPSTITGSFEELVWADEFDGSEVNREEWIFETGAGGWGNNELQNYTDGDNVEVSNGTLKITARQEKPGNDIGNFTSTRMRTKSSWKYGRIEISAKIPANTGNGVWPAIWMLSDTFPDIPWPKCGEIDIMEYVSWSEDNVHFTVHSEANNHMKGNHLNSGAISHPTIDEAFHTYGFSWTPDRIEFFIDDPSVVQYSVDRPDSANQDNWPFDSPFFLILNIAVGGSWGGEKGIEESAFPSTMEIDFVRIYGLNPDN